MEYCGDYCFKEEPESVLGRGAFGLVFRGRRFRFMNNNEQSATAHSEVAIKRLPSDRCKMDELDIVRQLRTPYVVDVLDVIEKAGYTYIVMELCDGTLNDHMEHVRDLRLKGMEKSNVEVVARSLAEGYLHLHRLNVIHRDIKPHNVLVNYAKDCGQPALFDSAEYKISQVKMADFGASRVSKMSMSNLAGTPYYMAPEVGANMVTESDYDSQVDMWSIGVLLYECITGDVPFEECDLCRLWLKASNECYEFYKPPPLPDDTEPFMTALVHRLLEVDYRKRLEPEQFAAAVSKRRESCLQSNGEHKMIYADDPEAQAHRELKQKAAARAKREAARGQLAEQQPLWWRALTAFSLFLTTYNCSSFPLVHAATSDAGDSL